MVTYVEFVKNNQDSISQDTLLKGVNNFKCDLVRIED